MVQKDVKSLQPNNIETSPRAVGMEIIFYTDPLCCWTWAMQPQWQRLLDDLRTRTTIAIKYKMGGLLPSWKHFKDNTNSIQRPAQMGPEWMHARHLSSAEINERIWITDPPASSFPSCIAVKCAELQAPDFTGPFLHLLQKAVMVNNLNIARANVLVDCASAFQARYSAFSVAKFKEDLFGEEAKEAFRKDMRECKYLNISRMPTILFRSTARGSLLLSGYQTDESLQKARSQL